MNEKNSFIEQEIPTRMPRRLSGRLCLDFVNTIDPRHGNNSREYLLEYSDLVTWGRYVEILTESKVQSLLQKAAQQPAIATIVFQRALTLREALYRIFSSVSEGKLPNSEDVAILNATLSEGMAQAQLLSTDESFVWTWSENNFALDTVLWSVARSAAELLTSEDLTRVKECPGNDGCGWLFVDTSRNHKRRWCDMEGCGNRAKARRHYERTR